MRGRAYIPDFAVSAIMLSLRSTIREYGHPTHVEKNGWRFPVIDHASPLPSQDCRSERHVVAVGQIEGYVCGAGALRDEIGITETAFDDFDAQFAHWFDVSGVPDQCSDLEVGVGLDDVNKHRA